jgi:hypothetical protein
MSLFTDTQLKQLIENGRNTDKDHPPVARLHILFNRCQWLISELSPEEPNIAFGLCDLGQGFPELGYVDLNELLALDVPFGILNDVFFEGKHPMSVYADAAREMSEITTEDEILKRHVRKLMP